MLPCECCRQVKEHHPDCPEFSVSDMRERMNRMEDALIECGGIACAALRETGVAKPEDARTQEQWVEWLATEYKATRATLSDLFDYVHWIAERSAIDWKQAAVDEEKFIELLNVIYDRFNLADWHGKTKNA